MSIPIEFLTDNQLIDQNLMGMRHYHKVLGEKKGLGKSKRIHVNFRLQPELFAVIEIEAEKMGTITTSIIEKIIQSYARKNIHIGQMNFLPISKDILKQVFKNRPKNLIKKEAKELGHTSGRAHSVYVSQN